MKKMKRWASILLTICMLVAALPVPAMTEPTATGTPELVITATPSPKPTDAPEPKGTGTPEPEVTGTPEPEVTGTPEPEATGTPESEVTGTPEPEATGTPEPEVTGTPEPEVTGTPEPETAGTPEPEATGTPEPEVTGTPEPEVSGTPEPEATGTPESEVTGTPEPMANGAPLLTPADDAVIENYDVLSEDIVYDRPVHNYGTISAGTFKDLVFNHENAKITGGTFKYRLVNPSGCSVSGAHLDCEIENSDVIRDCTFGPNANIKYNTGTIELTVTVDGQTQKVFYGANILATLGGDEWYYVSGNQYTQVGSGDTFSLTALTFESKLPSTQTAPQIDINYREETLTVNLPKDLDAGIDKAQIILHYQLDGEEHTVEGAFAQGDSCTIALKDLGLPGAKEKFLRFSLSYEGETGDAAALVVPARPGESNPGAGAGLLLINYVTEAEIHYIRQGYNVGMSMDPGAGEPDILVGLEGDILSSEAMQAYYYNLEADTEYFVFYRQNATDNSFQSEWHRYDETLKTEPYTLMNVSFNDPIREWDASKPVSEAIIKAGLIFTDEYGIPVDCYANGYTIEVRDAQGKIVALPITEAGDFTVKVTMLPDSYIAENYQLAEDTASFSIVRPSEADVRIDYQNEKMIVRRPQGMSADSADFSLKFALDGKEYTADNVFAGGDSYAIDLATLSMMLGRTLPGESGEGAANVSIVLYADGAEVQSYTLSVPARPALQKPEGELQYQHIYNTKLSILIPAIYDAGLKLADKAGEQPDIFGDASYQPLVVDYTGLTPGAAYAVCLRRKATPVSFSSSWGEVMTITTNATGRWLSVDANRKEYQWQPGFKLEKNTILNSLIFTDQNGNGVDNDDFWYDIEVMNDAGRKITLPILEPGVYTVRAIATEWKDHGTDFIEGKDSIEITVLPSTPGLHIGYADETIFFELPAGLESVASNITLKFALGDHTYNVPNAFADGNRCSIALSELGNALGTALPPSSDDGAVEITAELSIGDYTWEPYVIAIPARPKWVDSGAYYYVYSTSIIVENVGNCDVELRLESDTGSVTIPGYAFDATQWQFYNLTPGTEYTVCLRNKAAGESFASEWHYDKQTTSGVEDLTIGIRKSEYTWAPGFSLNDTEIRGNLFSLLTETGEEPNYKIPTFIYTDARLEITDSEGQPVSLPIEDPGEYTFKFIPVDQDIWGRGYRYAEDTFTISVQPVSTPGVHLDYFNEAVAVVLPEELSGGAADASLKFTLGDQTYPVPNAFADGSSYTVSLSELGAQLGVALPGEGEAGAANVVIELSIGGVAQEPYTLHIPARPAYREPSPNMHYEEGYNFIAVFEADSAFSVGLKPTGEPGDAPTIPATEIDPYGYVIFDNLPSGVGYTICLSVKATEENFRSAWHAWKTVRTMDVLKLNAGTSTPKYVWKSGFALYEADIRRTVRISDAETGQVFDYVHDEMYTIEVTDADGQPALPIQEPGVYTVRIIPTDEWPMDGTLVKDTFEITVSIQAEATVDFVNEAVKVSLPKGLNADRLGGITLSFALNGVRYAYSDAFAGGGTRAVSLEELSELFKKPLPGENGAARLYVMLTSDDVVEETPYMLSIPARPDSPGMPPVTCEEGYTDIAILDAAAYDAGLSPAGEAGGAPAIIGEKRGEDIYFANLTADTAYALYLRTAATKTSFSSAWEKQPDGVKTKKLTRLIAGASDPLYVWTSGESGAPLDEDIIRDRLRFTDAENPELSVEVFDEMYAIEVVDANGGVVTPPVNRPGVYTVRIVETEAWSKGYVLEKDSFKVTVSVKPEVDIDFFEEALTVRLPKGLDGEVMKALALTFELDGGTAHTVSNAFTNGSCTIALSELGEALNITLPDASKDVPLAIRLPEINGAESAAYTMSIPKRLNTLEIQPYATANAGGCTQIWASRIKEGGETGLKPTDEEGDEPTIFGEWRDNEDEFGLRSVLFSGLTPGTEYRLYIRSAATETSFQTLWQDLGRPVSTNPISIYLQAAASPDEYDWFSGFSLDAAAIQDSIVNKSAAGLEYEPLGTPDIEVMDERGASVTLPIKDPGVYTVRAILSEADRNAGRAYAEGKDTFTIAVKLPDDGGMFIDYAGETVIVKLPEALKDQAENVGLSFTVGDAVYSVGNVFASDRLLFTISLSELGGHLGLTLPPSYGAEAVELTVELLLPGDPAHSFTETINPRPEAPSKDAPSAGIRSATELKFKVDGRLETRSYALKSPDGQMIYPSSVEEGYVCFTGLTPETVYSLWTCTKATADSFRSDWILDWDDVNTLPRKKLKIQAQTLEYTWQSGFALDAADIQSVISFYDDSSQPVSIDASQYTIEVTDSENKVVELPIRDPGWYSVKVTAADTFPDDYEIDPIQNFIGIDVNVEASVGIDYVKEELTVRLPEGLDAGIAEKIEVRVGLPEASATPRPIALVNGSAAISLSELGEILGGLTLPAENGVEQKLEVTRSGVRGLSAKTYPVTIPARPEAKDYGFPVNSKTSFTSVDISPHYGETWNMVGLRETGSTGSEPNIFPSSVNGNVFTFANLKPAVDYTILLCEGATEGRFRSKWNGNFTFKMDDYTYLNAIPATSVYPWKEGFSLDEDGIRSSILFLKQTNIEVVTLTAEQYAIEVTDDQGTPVILPIQEPGRYTVKVAGTEALPEEYKFAQDSFDITVSVQPSADIDFINEALTVSLPEGLDSEVMKNLTLTFGLDGKQHAVSNAFANGSYTVTLSELGAKLQRTLPGESGAAARMTIRLSAINGAQTPYSLTIPARPDAPVMGSNSFNTILKPTTWRLQVLNGYNNLDVGLRLASAAGSEPTILHSGVDGNEYLVTGLTPETEYMSYVRFKATDKSFRSAWIELMPVETKAYTYLDVAAATLDYAWHPGFSLDEAALRGNFKFTAGIWGSVLLDDAEYDVTVTDAEGKTVILPILEPGKYTVTVTETDALFEDYAIAPVSFDITVSIRVSAKIDFINEKLTVLLPEWMREGAEDISLTFALNGEAHTIPNAFENGSCTIALSDLGKALGNVTLPDDLNDVTVNIRLSSFEGREIEPYSHTIPRRPAYSWQGPQQPTQEVGYTVITIQGVAAYEGGLKPKDAEGNGPTIFGVKDGDRIHFTNLALDTYYVVYLRNMATEEAFCSPWKAQMGVAHTMPPKMLEASTTTSEYQWTPGFSLDETTIKKSIVSTRTSTGREEYIHYLNYVIAVTDEQDAAVTLPVEQPGVYKVKVGLTEAWADDHYVFDPDTFTITVKPLDLSDGNVSISLSLADDQMAVYTGEAVYPEPGDTGIRIAIDGKPAFALTSDYYTIGAAQGKNNVNAGEAWMTISAKNGQNCVVNSKEIKYEILPQQAELSVSEELCRTVWSKGFSLTQEALSKVFAVNDAAGKPIDGKLYTFSVTQDGAEVQFPITSAGSYTVEVKLSTGNYALKENTFAYTVSKLPFAGTVSMNGYVYGETPSTPALSGYAGDGEVSYQYRAGQNGKWQKWENITPTSLLPGGYEIKAIAAATVNSAGGETAAAQFTVSPMELGAAIVMSDYTYGGEVPVPALEPAVEGLPVAWFYQGADGAEHPWANMTGTTLNAGGYTLIARVTSDVHGDPVLKASFTVLKAQAPAFQWPTAEGITYGQPLSEVKLSAEADEFGAFRWANPEEILNAGAQKAVLKYIPKDTVNYDYTGVELSKEIDIVVEVKDMGGEDGKDFTIEPIPDQNYTGKPVEPKLRVKDGEKLLTEGVDYSVAYANNVNLGTATATITGMGNYTGTLTAEFVIREKKDEDKDGEEDENDKNEGAGALTPDALAEKLSAGEAVEGIVTDRAGEPAPYEAAAEELLDEAQGEVIRRTLVITAKPVLDEDGQPVLKDGEPVYQQRNLHLSRALLGALADKGYTHIRFELKDAALEWMIADMTAEGNVIRLAPMEEGELSKAERKAIGEAEMLTDGYRARITAVTDGEEADITSAIPSLLVIFDREHIRALAEDEMAQLLIVPGDGEPEAQMLDILIAEDVEAGRARYEAALTESGLFLMILKEVH